MENELLRIDCFGIEIASLGWDSHRSLSRFQFNADYLESGQWMNLFPATGILKRVEYVQVFNQFNNEAFRGLPPMVADSLPDAFGNRIFSAWLEATHRELSSVSAVEQLAYVANRGMGALEFRPAKELPTVRSIDLSEIIEVLNEVIQDKASTRQSKLNDQALLTIFQIGSSAGGVRPKVVVAQNTATQEVLPGDIAPAVDHRHLLVKLDLGASSGYPRERLEYAYYRTATSCGIDMMPSELIEGKHFATERFDRRNGAKVHTLTASGMTGWRMNDPAVSSYENLFELAHFLRLPHSDLEQLFARMVFNVAFMNTDDHLKNHAFVYHPEDDQWRLSPAYDVTYALNPNQRILRVSRALSVNGKRSGIDRRDFEPIAERFTIRRSGEIIERIAEGVTILETEMDALDLPQRTRKAVLESVGLGRSTP